MSETLPPFSGDDTTCSKCLYVGALTLFLEFGECVHGPGIGELIGYTPNPRLHRECERCGYQWDEALAVPPEAPVSRHSHTWENRDSDDARCRAPYCRTTYGQYRDQVQKERDDG